MKRPEIDFLAEYDDESLLAELRRIAEATGSGTVTKSDIKRIGRVSHLAVVNRFGSLQTLTSTGSRPVEHQRPSNSLISLQENLSPPTNPSAGKP